MAKNMIWVGVRADRGVVEASTSLKVLCDGIGLSYSTAVSKKSKGRFVLWAKKGGEEAMWYVQEVRLSKVSGRGRF